MTQITAEELLEWEASDRPISELYEEKVGDAGLGKGRRYIDDPSEAPEDAEVHEGPQGGLWYETGDGAESESDDSQLPEYDSDDPQWVDLDDEGQASEGDVVLVWDDEAWEEHVGVVTETAGMVTTVELASGEEVMIDHLSFEEDLAIHARFEEGRTEEEAEDPFHDKPWDSEEEREAYLEELQEEHLQEVNYYDIPAPDAGTSSGTEISDAEIGNTEPNDFGVRADPDDVATLQETLETGSLGDELGVEVNISEIPDDTPFGESDYGRPDKDDPYTDVAIATEDFLNLQFELQHKHFPAGQDYQEHRRNFFGHVNVDDIKDFAETLREEPGEMDYPALFLRNDGSVDNYQEGRHRALAAWIAGVDEIPVRVILDASRDAKSQTAEKGRRYVDDPSEAPEGVEVQEGEQGGLYYETDDASGEGGVDAGDAEDLLGRVEVRDDVDEEMAATFIGGASQTFSNIRNQDVAETLAENLYVTGPQSQGMHAGGSSFVEDLMSEGGTVKLEVGKNTQYATINHELAHGIAQLYGYDVSDGAIELANNYGVGADNPPDEHYAHHGIDSADELKFREERSPDRPEEINTLIAEANDALERQFEAVQDGHPKWDNFTIGDNYSATNAQETLAMTHESLSFSPEGNDDQYAEVATDGIRTLAHFHPDLLRAYTAVFEPSGWAKEQLRLVDEQEFAPVVGEILGDEKSERNVARKGYVSVADMAKPEIDLGDKTRQQCAQNFKQVDDLLTQCFCDQVWEDDVTKAPASWERDDDVPAFVRQHLKDAIERTDALHDEFAEIPEAAALKVQEIIHDEVTSPSGWSIQTVVKELLDYFDDMDRKQAEAIARTEIASILNTAKELAYDTAAAAQAANMADNITGLPPQEALEDFQEDVGYYWAGPEDHATTNICSETKKEIEDRGGYVTKDELKEILREKVREYEEEDGGLPDRVESFVPHYNCRHTFIREDYQQLT